MTHFDVWKSGKTLISLLNWQNLLFKSFPTFWWYGLSFDFIPKFSRLILQWKTKVTLGILCSKPYFKHFI
jgi:hypothetical protein